MYNYAFCQVKTGTVFLVFLGRLCDDFGKTIGGGYSYAQSVYARTAQRHNCALFKYTGQLKVRG